MDNSSVDAASGLSLPAGSSRQMKMQLREATRIIGTRANSNGKHLSTQRSVSARKGRTTGRPVSNKAAKNKKQKSVPSPRPEVEESTQQASSVATQLEQASSAPEQVVTLYFRSPSRATESNTQSTPPVSEIAPPTEGCDTSPLLVSEDSRDTNEDASSTQTEQFEHASSSETAGLESESGESSFSSSTDDTSTADIHENTAASPGRVLESQGTQTSETATDTYAYATERHRTLFRASSATSCRTDRERASSAPPALASPHRMPSAHPPCAARHRAGGGDLHARAPFPTPPTGGEERGEIGPSTLSAPIAQDDRTEHSSAGGSASTVPSPHSGGHVACASSSAAFPLPALTAPPTPSRQPARPSPPPGGTEQAAASSAMSSATNGASANRGTTAITTQGPTLGPMRPIVEDAFSNAEYEQARIERGRKNKLGKEKPKPTHPNAEPQTNGAAPQGTSKNSSRNKRGRRMHQLDILREHQAASEEPQSTAPTILYRPKGRKNNFLGLSRDAIAAQLSRVPGAKRVRVNFRGNVVAVDCTPGADTAPLLTVQHIGQVEVRAKMAAKGTCAGVLYGVDPSLDTETVLENLECPAPVISCTRNGRDVVVRFAGSAPPAEVALFKHARSVRARRRRPLQCRKCGGYGHCDATCTSSPRCLRCGGDHARAQCTETRAKCFHCNGNHPATEPRCPRWQHERKILEVMASRDPPLSRRDAEKIIKTQEKGAPPSAPSRPISSAVKPGITYRAALAPTTSQPTPSTDIEAQKDAVIAALAAAVQALVETIPQSSPAFHLCNAALAAHFALTHHG